MAANTAWPEYASVIALGGAPKVTFPSGDDDYPVVERVLERPLGEEFDFGDADIDATRFSTVALVAKQELGSNGQSRRMYLRYERLPGALTFTTTTDDEYGVEIKTTRRMVSSNTEPPKLNDTAVDWGAGSENLTGRRRIPTIPSTGTSLSNQGQWESVTAYVIHTDFEDIPGSLNKTLVVVSVPLPYERYDFPELTFPFPGLYHSWTSPLIVVAGNGRAPLWFFSTGILFVASRTKSVRAAKLTQFSTTPSTSMPPEFSVRTAGPESSYIRQIDNNTIHPQITVTNSGGTAIEYIPVSIPAPMSTPSAPANQAAMLAMTPHTYLPRYYLLRPVQTRWRGEIWKREYTIVSEIENMESKALAATFSAHATSPVTINTFLANGYKDWT